MATIRRFEDLEVWQRARILSKEVYSLTWNGEFSKDFDLRSQIRRSSGSVMDNVAEGFERGGNREFIRFLTISKGSSAELKSQLYRALDQNYIIQSQFDFLYQNSDEIGKMLNGFIDYLNSSDFKGKKYKNRDS